MIRPVSARCLAGEGDGQDEVVIAQQHPQQRRPRAARDVQQGAGVLVPPQALVGGLAGAGMGTAGAMLLTLPALSVPSMVMVGKALGWRTTTAMAGAVVLGGVLAGVVLQFLA